LPFKLQLVYILLNTNYIFSLDQKFDEKN